MSNTISELNDSLIGRYLVEKEPGQGGMATVYLARDVRHDRKLAINVGQASTIVMVENWIQELKAKVKK